MNKHLVAVLKTLAETKDNQVSYLIRLGTFPSTDELALEFSDTYQPVKPKLKENTSHFKKKVIENLEKIDLLFDEMSNIQNNVFWNADSLDGIEWNKVRELSKEILSILMFENLKTD